MSDDKLERIENKLDGVAAACAAHSVAIADTSRRIAGVETRLMPIERHVHMADGVIKVIGLLALVATICEVFIKCAWHG